MNIILVGSLNAQSDCGNNLTDSGGLSASYSSNENDIQTVCANTGMRLKVNFLNFDLENNFDVLYVYNGNSLSSPIIGVFTGSELPEIIESSGSCLTFQLLSDNNIEKEGFSANIDCVAPQSVQILDIEYEQSYCDAMNGSIIIQAESDQDIHYSIDGGENYQSSPTFINIDNGIYHIAVANTSHSQITHSEIVLPSTCYEICNNGIDDNKNGIIDEFDCHEIYYTCDSVYYDDGGALSNYSFNLNQSVTYCSGNATQIQTIFEEFELDLGILPDTLLVYDGMDIHSPLIGKYYGRPIVTGSEFRINSFFQSTNHCLTFQLKSGEYGVRKGWKAHISCTDEICNTPEVNGNGIDDDKDGWIDDQDTECLTGVEEPQCSGNFTYYIAPVWQMGGNPMVYSDPGVLCFSTVYDSADIYIYNADYSFQKNIVAYSQTSKTITLEQDLLRTPFRNQSESNRGLIVQSNVPININYLMNGFINKNFIAVKGREALGRSFVAGSQTNTLVQTYEGKERKEHHFVSVMATEDNTEVTFRFNRPMKGIQSPHVITLQRGQTYLITDEDYNVTISGVKISSDKDITVVSGSQHTHTHGTLSRDGGADMLVSNRHLGDEYILVRGGVEDGFDYGIVVATQNNTRIYTDDNPEPLAILNSGEFIQVDLSGALGSLKYISADNKIAVYHVSGISGTDVGMTIVPAIGECRGENKINFPRFEMSENMMLNVIVPTAAIGSLTFNGLPLLGQNVTIQTLLSPQYSSIIIPNDLIVDNNILEGNDKFHASLLIGDETNTGSIAYLTTYTQKINVIDPTTNFPTNAYDLGRICSDSELSHTIQLEGCATKNKITGISGNIIGDIEITGDLSFLYTSNSTLGNDDITIQLSNDLGVKTVLCIHITVDGLEAEIDPNIATPVCSYDTTILSFQSIGGVGPYQYIWSTGETTPSISVSPDTSEYYQVTVQDSRGCSTEEEVYVNILPSVVADAGTDINVCYGELAYLEATTTNASNGTWSGGLGLFNNKNISNAIYTPHESEVGTTFYLYWDLESVGQDLCYVGSDSVLISVTDVLQVYAGEDANICKDQAYKLTNLGSKLNSNNIQDGTWTSDGDGYFMPSLTSSCSFLEALEYYPGESDINNGQVALTLSAFDPNGLAACNSDSDEVMLYIDNAPTLVCNDNLNISLNAHCTFPVTVDLLLEGEITDLNNYVIILTNHQGDIIPNNTINSSHIGIKINYTVSYACGQNSCSGEFMVEDKQIPNLACQDTIISCIGGYTPEDIGFPFSATYPIFENNNSYTVQGFDGCTDVNLSYEDEEESFNCLSDYQKVITRIWTAEDEYGNSTTCNQKIYISHGSLDNVKLTLDYDDTTLPSFSCTDEFEMTDEGFPSPTVTGYPTAGNCAQIESTYTDLYFELCGGGYKILRTWKIFDWCSSTDIEDYQIIMVVDKQAPEIMCSPNVVISTSQYSCASGLYLIDLPNVTDDCSELIYDLEVTDSIGNEIEVNGSNNTFTVTDMPLGSNIVEFTISDLCGNSSVCSYIVEVKDLIAPTMVCDQHTIVSLTNNGNTRLYASSIDDNGYDNCGIASFEIRKMSDICGFGLEFGEFVEFCCSEVGETQQVVMKATDIYGNINHCMVEVELVDKIAPFIEAPTDITIGCETYFDLMNLEPFGKIVYEQAEREDIIIYDDFNNGVAGKDGIAIDNCNVAVKDTAYINRQCGEGYITRVFTATDNFGQSTLATQKITISKSDWFNEDDITWPEDVEYEGCKMILSDTTITGKPTLHNLSCSSISTSYKDKIFNSSDEACVLILRTWSVLDICQFDADTEEGLWKHIQTITFNNAIAPTITSPTIDTLICSYGECGGNIQLSLSAIDDCTDQDELSFAWSIDANADGLMEYEGTGAEMDIYLENGNYKVYWRVQDDCSNMVTAAYNLWVKDCKAPTPLCLNSLSTALMDEAGQVTILASNYNLKGEDNCTPEESLKFSFSPNVLDNVLTFTCDDLENGISEVIDLEIWVTDLAGNQDYCSVQILVEDHFNTCPNTGEITLNGQITTTQGSAYPHAKVSLLSPEESPIFMNSAENGTYSFGPLTPGNDYEISAASNDENWMNGVTALDIVMIQKHILYIEPFTEDIDYIAADVNGSGTITGTDIVILRKAFFSIIDHFPNNMNWQFKSNVTDAYPNDHYLFDRAITLPAQELSLDQLDFTAIKSGDVSRNAIPAEARSNEIATRSNNQKIIATLNGQEILFRLEEPSYFEAFQMELQFDELSNSFNITDVNNNIQLFHRQMSNQTLRFLGQQSGSSSMLAEEDIFKMRFENNLEANKAFTSLQLNADFEVQWVGADLDLHRIELIKHNIGNELDELMLFSGVPNPFSDRSDIQIYTPITQTLLFTINDIHGNVIYNESMKLESGSHLFTITNRIIPHPGVYYYTISNQQELLSRKIIKVN